MSKTTKKYSPELRERAVRLVMDNQVLHESRWSAILSISWKIGCAPQTLNEWGKKAELDRRDRPIQDLRSHGQAGEPRPIVGSRQAGQSFAARDRTCPGAELQGLRRAQRLAPDAP